MSTDLLVLQETQSILPTGTTDSMLIDMWLEKGKHSACTQDAYKRDVNMFLSFICGKPLQSVTLADVQQYARSLVGKPSTINRRLAVLKSLFSFATDTGYTRFNICRMLEMEAVPSGLAQRILSEETLIRMISLEENKRNHCILRLLYHAGLRVSELVALDWSMITERNDGMGQITVIGKGVKERQVLLQASMYKELLSLKKDTPEVFTSKKRGRLQSRQIEYIVKAAAIRAGIDVNVSPHWFRHAHASHSLDRGAPVSLGDVHK
jgi:site-specific recombinase XerD